LALWPGRLPVGLFGVVVLASLFEAAQRAFPFAAVVLAFPEIVLTLPKDP
jgi:hypothetical protein